MVISLREHRQSTPFREKVIKHESRGFVPEEGIWLPKIDLKNHLYNFKWKVGIKAATMDISFASIGSNTTKEIYT